MKSRRVTKINAQCQKQGQKPMYRKGFGSSSMEDLMSTGFTFLNFEYWVILIRPNPDYHFCDVKYLQKNGGLLFNQAHILTVRDMILFFGGKNEKNLF